MTQTWMWVIPLFDAKHSFSASCALAMINVRTDFVDYALLHNMGSVLRLENASYVSTINITGPIPLFVYIKPLHGLTSVILTRGLVPDKYIATIIYKTLQNKPAQNLTQKWQIMYIFFPTPHSVLTSLVDITLDHCWIKRR